MTRPSRALITATFAMMAVVCASNYLVQFPLPLLPDWLTWGALTYPFAFLVTDLTNRLAGPACARRAVICGFALGVTLSVITATPRIALASGTAFLLGQLLDISLLTACASKAGGKPRCCHLRSAPSLIRQPSSVWPLPAQTPPGCSWALATCASNSVLPSYCLPPTAWR